jgi:predicted GNAT family acetyltransferase
VKARTDVARLLGATGPGAWVLAAFFGITFFVIAFWVDGEYTGSPLGFSALLLMVGAAVLLVLPQLSPLPHLAAAAIVGASVFATAAGLWQLEADAWRGWVTWYIGASSYLSFTLALRGRFWWGIADLLAITAVAMHWTAVTTGDPLAGIGLTYPQIILFGAGAFFALWLRRTADRITAFHETRVRRESAEGARYAADEERERELRVVRAAAGGALERIASGVVDEHERREHLLLEAELRDRIRGRGLAVAVVTAAARDARRRGGTVALLDDLRSDAPPVGHLREALDWAADRIARSGTREVTVRLTASDGRPVVTFATADGETAVFRPRETPPAMPDPRA